MFGTYSVQRTSAHDVTAPNFVPKETSGWNVRSITTTIAQHSVEDKRVECAKHYNDALHGNMSRDT